MKKQFRHKVFETNSSSINTLTIKKINDVDAFWNNLSKLNYLMVGNTKVEDVMSLEFDTLVVFNQIDFQTKLDLLFYSRFNSFGSVKFLDNFYELMNIFKEEQIVVSIYADEFVKGFENYAWLFSNSDLLEAIRTNIKDRESIAHFLSTSCGFFACYEDNITEDKYDDIAKMEHNFVNDSKDDLIIMNYRC